MPELPEVETIKNELSPRVVGRLITAVTVRDPKPVREPTVKEFQKRLVGQRIDRIERRGKYLIFRLSNEAVLVVHLKMTGALLLSPNQIDRYNRVVFDFDDGVQLFFSDRRRLGAMWLVEDERSVTGKLGPEPLTRGFTLQALAQGLRKRKAPIKAVLLDQAFLAGIGNMYADESLFAAKIHPLRAANTLSPEEIKRLHRNIVHVLRSAIDSQGASTDTYQRPDGRRGTAHLGFSVAHRGGKPCPICGTPIQRVTIRGRGSYYCPHCQTL